MFSLPMPYQSKKIPRCTISCINFSFMLRNLFPWSHNNTWFYKFPIIFSFYCKFYTSYSCILTDTTSTNTTNCCFCFSSIQSWSFSLWPISLRHTAYTSYCWLPIICIYSIFSIRFIAILIYGPCNTSFIYISSIKWF